MLWKNNQFFTDVPFPKVKDRPLIVAHPGAHMNYLASWNVMVDNEAPFVLVCDDLSPAYPDGWWSSHSHNGAEYFARISNPKGIGQAYRNPDLGFQNLLIHRGIEAKEGLKDSHSSISCTPISLRFFFEGDSISSQKNLCFCKLHRCSHQK